MLKDSPKEKLQRFLVKRGILLAKHGFIPRYKNETIVQLMGYGKRFVAYVDESRKEIPKEEREKESHTEESNLLFLRRVR